MTAGPFDSALLGPLLSDEEAAALFTDEATVRSWLAFEAALARAEAKAGVIPKDAADPIAKAAESLKPDMAALGAETARTGLAIPNLVAQIRAGVDGEAINYVHWGATSQDVIDTGLVLRLRDLCDLLDGRLAEIIKLLADQATRHRNVPMPGRTRSQQALPVSFGLKIAGWLEPLIRHRKRLEELRPRLLVLQFGGAAGTLAALGKKGVKAGEALAKELKLPLPAVSRHTQRDAIAEFASWLSLVTGSLGKMGQDLMLLAANEVGEASAGEGGGSSTLPQKNNPIAGEALVALARFNAGMVGTVHQAMVQEHERGGPGWTLEWMTLPQMAVAAAAALRHGLTVAETLAPDAERMRANLEASNGLILAEAASFALSEHMPRAEAQALVKDACRTAAEQDRHLMDVLSEASDAPVDWQALRDPANYLGAASELIDRVLREV